MPFRLAFEQPDRARTIGAHKIEKIGRGLRDPKQNGLGAGKAGDQIAGGSSLFDCEAGQPVGQPLLGLGGSGQIRSVHETRGQTTWLRVTGRR